MMTFLAILVAVCILVFIGGRHILKWIRFYTLARRLPSPKGIPFIGNFELTNASLTEIHTLIGRYFEECPRFYTIWLGPFSMVFLRDPRDVEMILGSGFKNVRKSFIYDFVKPLMGDGLGLAEVEKWEQHRKLLSPAFHIKSLENYIEVFVRISEILVKKLGEEVGQQSFDCNTYLVRAAIDTTYECLMGIESNFLKNGHDNLSTPVKIVSQRCIQRVMSPWLYPDCIYWKTSSGKECKRLIEGPVNDIQQMIKNKQMELNLYNESRENLPEDEVLGGTERPTFLELLLRGSEYGVKLSDEDITDEVKTFLIAGFDTVRLTLCWAMQILGNHMDIQEKIYEEVEDILQGSNRSPTMTDLAQMKYLERVIKEVLRLYPALPITSTMSLRDLQIGGYTIPAGMMINIPIAHVHRNPEIYPDPEKFDPDRFLPQAEHRHPYTFIPFSSGPRNCIGQKFAMLQLKIMLYYIIRNYKIYSLREKLTPLIEMTLTSEEGFHITISSRNS